MLKDYLIFSVSISFISWIVGMVINAVLMKTNHYQKLSKLNFIENKAVNKNLGLPYFKWIVKNTPFKFFNPNMKLKAKVVYSELVKIRKEMTFSEISHLAAFLFVGGFALVKVVYGQYLFSFVIMLVNALMNLYPSLLQQENKRRIDRLMESGRFFNS
ncbi:hypothetical protein [uncultured Cyclobacterium sp.]|uniref:glycosyl-4,4'-diaponeurosporenoate acyltransferase CrtO family protein n=1 Tax=uncultured Cyclobacterium sp. TaxID=453820 RepID=UPI0030ED9852